MLNQYSSTQVQSHLAAVPDEDFAGHEIIGGDLASGLIVICDHARSALPARYESLGLPQSEFSRHIAFDIGVESVTRTLAARLGVPAIMTRFSRLLIDPNRGLDDPTLIMKLSDGAVVPGNADIDQTERDRRIERYYAPYHAALSDLIETSMQRAIVPALLSIHSFTAHWKGVARPWDAGILWDKSDRRFSDLLITGLAAERHLTIGDNEPYSGALAGDTMDKHGTGTGLAHALLEIRQDLVVSQQGIDEWTDRLAALLPEITANPAMHSTPVARE